MFDRVNPRSHIHDLDLHEPPPHFRHPVPAATVVLIRVVQKVGTGIRHKSVRNFETSRIGNHRKAFAPSTADLPSVSMENVDVIFPCLDEAAALPAVLGALPPGFRAIVVDNGSTDDSVRIAEQAGAKVVHEPRRGYGAAVH